MRAALRAACLVVLAASAANAEHGVTAALEAMPAGVGATAAGKTGRAITGPPSVTEPSGEPSGEPSREPFGGTDGSLGTEGGHRSSHAWPQPAAGPSRSGDPELIFTFDDGPNEKTTPRVLDVLAAHHVHAVFFLVGSRVAQPWAPAIVARMVREGHIVANHTMHHADLCELDDDAHAAREIDRSKAMIEGASGLSIAWFREPYGTRCRRLERLLAERNLRHFHWDLDPQEWKRGHRKEALDYVEKKVGKTVGRDVLLMHDMKKATVADLPAILDWIDTENARRAETHLRRIRIVQSYELAIEQLPEGLVDWLAEAAPDPSVLARAVASVIP